MNSKKEAQFTASQAGNSRKAGAKISACGGKNMNSILKKMFLLLLFLGLASCSTFNTFSTESRPPDHQIIVDGTTDDWRGDLYVVEGERVSLGLLNDRENLYVCLLAEDQVTRAQIMMQGLTVWFDPQGGKKKAFGIKFPLGMPPGERTFPSEDNQEGPGFENPPGVPLTELEIIRSDEETPQKLNISQVKGIEIKAVPSTGLLVYELKIPLIQTEQHPLAVGAEPGKTIGIGFETGKFDPSKMRRRSGGMPGGGGRPPMGGGSGQGGRGGMDRFGRGFQMLESLKIWAIVKLAQAQSSRWPELLFLSH